MSTEPEFKHPVLAPDDADALADANRLAQDVLMHFGEALAEANERNNNPLVPIEAHGVVMFAMPDREQFHLLTVKHGEIERLGMGLMAIRFVLEDPDHAGG